MGDAPIAIAGLSSCLNQVSANGENSDNGLLCIHRLHVSMRQATVGRYAFEYGVFFAWALARVSFLHARRRYDVVYVHNMPNFRNGLDLMVRALSMLVGEFPRLRLRVIGDGPALEPVRGPGSPGDLARAIRDLLTHPAAAQDRAFSSRIKLDKLDWPAQKETLVGTVEALVGSARPRSRRGTEPLASPGRDGLPQADHRTSRQGGNKACPIHAVPSAHPRQPEPSPGRVTSRQEPPPRLRCWSFARGRLGARCWRPSEGHRARAGYCRPAFAPVGAAAGEP